MTSTRTLGRILAIVFGAVLSVSFLGACGSSSDTASANEWATDVCTSLASYVERLKSTALSAVGENSTDLATTKADLIKFTEGGVTSTDELIDQINGIGAPDLDNGEAMASSLRDTLDDVKRGFVEAKDQAEALPVDNELAFTQGAQELSARIQTAGEKATQTLQEATKKYPEMGKALSEQPACKQVNPG